MALVGMKEINGEKYEIHAGQYGEWSIKPPQQEGDDKPPVTLGAGDTLDKAVANARVAINKGKVKLKIHFITLAGERGVATGKHARTRQILTTIEGKKEHLDSWRVKVLRPDTPQSELDRLAEIAVKISKLQKEQGEIISEYSFDLTKEVDKQIAEAVSK